MPSQHVRKARILLVGGWICAMCACSDTRFVPVFRAQVLLDDRGIFVPLPPPSFTANPMQTVVLGGSVDVDAVDDETVVRVVDQLGEADVLAELDGEGSFVAMFDIDLRDNCIEVWVERPHQEGPHVRIHAEIVSATELSTLEGCHDLDWESE